MVRKRNAEVMNTFEKHFDAANAQQCDQIVISGAGLAGLFTAYQLLHQAKLMGKPMDVAVLTDKINAPCSAGSHVVLEHEGLFEDDVIPEKDRIKFSEVLRDGQAELEDIIAREGIDCSYSRGYEWKASTQEELDECIDDVVAKHMYRRDEFDQSPAAQKFNLPGLDYSAHLDCIGQVNTPALLNGLVDKIREMGGKVHEGVRYESQEKLADGRYAVHTDTGTTFISRGRPVICTGPEHMSTLPELKDTQVVYTMGLVYNNISDKYKKMITTDGGPLAMGDLNMDGDVLWGGLDSKGNLTMGRGDSVDKSPERIAELKEDIGRQVEGLYPGLTKDYDPTVTYGAMLYAGNSLPIVGRLKDYDVMGGWGGEGIVPGMAAAKAYAQFILTGKEETLQLYESFQKDIFKGQWKQDPGVRHIPPKGNEPVYHPQTA